MSDSIGGPCCAHTRVNYVRVENEARTQITGEYWECADCKIGFVPASKLLARLNTIEGGAAITVLRGFLFDRRDKPDAAGDLSLTTLRRIEKAYATMHHNLRALGAALAAIRNPSAGSFR